MYKLVEQALLRGVLVYLQMTKFQRYGMQRGHEDAYHDQSVTGMQSWCLTLVKLVGKANPIIPQVGHQINNIWMRRLWMRLRYYTVSLDKTWGQWCWPQQPPFHLPLGKGSNSSLTGIDEWSSSSLILQLQCSPSPSHCFNTTLLIHWVGSMDFCTHHKVVIMWH